MGLGSGLEVEQRLVCCVEASSREAGSGLGVLRAQLGEPAGERDRPTEAHGAGEGAPRGGAAEEQAGLSELSEARGGRGDDELPQAVRGRGQVGLA